MKIWIVRCTALMMFLIVFAGHGRAEDWLLVETRSVPNTCPSPLECVADSELIARNLMALSTSNRAALLGFLSSAATFRDIPDAGAPAAARLPESLHKLPISAKLAPLINHPGVYFDSTQLDRNPQTKGIADLLRSALSQSGLKFLTKTEWQRTPGRPRLSLSFVARNETAGCIVPFVFYMSIKEEVVLARRPDLKIEATIWSNSRRQNLASTRHAPRNALSELAQVFLTDWQKANAGG